jgi:hypothetical protein
VVLRTFVSRLAANPDMASCRLRLSLYNPQSAP